MLWPRCAGETWGMVFPFLSRTPETYLANLWAPA